MRGDSLRAFLKASNILPGSMNGFLFLIQCFLCSLINGQHEHELLDYNLGSWPMEQSHHPVSSRLIPHDRIIPTDRLCVVFQISRVAGG